jgi:2'-hydroxyisoflavone reductase
MPRALVVGGTRFVGRHAVAELLDHDYDVTMFNRGTHPNPFGDRVEHVAGDRTERSDLERAAAAVDPDTVIDCVAYHPGDVETATRVFAGVDAYVYVSSVAAYSRDEVPSREGETPIYDAPADEADAGYGERKAGGDRAVFAAAERGVNAISARPCLIYGPHDYRERLDYWIDRLRRYHRVILPGDGATLWHRAYVEDVATALRVLVEDGEPGEAYNVGDRRLLTLESLLERVADALDTDVEMVHASDRELAADGLSTGDFPLYLSRPLVYDTQKLADLGWESTPLDVAVERTVADHLDSDRDGAEHDPGRDREQAALDRLGDPS